MQLRCSATGSEGVMQCSRLGSLIGIVLACSMAGISAEEQPEDQRPSLPVQEGAIPHVDPGRHSGRITALLFTPDERELVSVSEDKTIRVWDTASGELVRT